ncbi:MAG: ATP-binding protein [Planctomycetota bacterium]|nr:ATP-binding protein [Planctomycetaceae bacterium]MDQ3330129.1 ATP-binding protein [Planctomycetota bacterium]
MTTALVVEKQSKPGSVYDLVVKHDGWSAERTCDPAAALDRLGSAHFELLVADSEALREHDDWLSTVRDRFPDLPVVIVTSRGRDHEQTVKALMLGAATFVPRDHLARDLVATIERIVAICCPDETPPVGEVLTETVHRYVLPNDRQAVTPVLRHVQGELERFDVCNKPDRLRVAVALEEAMINAIVHGNLDVSSKLREQGDDAFEKAIAMKRATSPYRERRASLVATFHPGHATFVITDEGTGFDPGGIPDPTDPENLIKPYGRGLLLMRTFMNTVDYNATGNEVTLVKRRSN